LENLLLGAKEGTTQEDILRAVELAEIREDIERMPLNYQTELTSDGAGISGGQRQRIALARALLTDAPVLILDEATSSLDILTEKRIVDNLMTLDKTLIFIAHRLTSGQRRLLSWIRARLLKKESMLICLHRVAFTPIW